MNNNIPVIKSTIYKLSNINDMVILKDVLTNDPQFLRLCNASPKDICQPLFTNQENVDDIINVFKSSSRTFYMFDQNHCCLVVRPQVQIDYEVRCYWHEYQLRAVCGPGFYIDENIQNNIKLLILQFFTTYNKNITYNSATIDLGIHQNDVFVIEFNSFGSDMLAGLYYFDWQEDFMILYNSKEPVFRFKDKYSW